MLLGEERNDPKAQRGQLIGFALIAVAFTAWLYIFPPPAQQAAQQPAAEQAAQPAPPAPDAAIASLPPASVSPEQLPPVAEAAGDPSADEVTLENGELRLVFTAVGGRLKGAKVILGKDGALSQELVPAAKDGEADKDRVLPLGLRFSKAYLGDALDQRRWTPERGADGKSVSFSIELPGQAKIVKRFSLVDDSHLIQTEVSYTNIGAASQKVGEHDHDPAFALNWGPAATTGDTLKGLHQELIWRDGEFSEVAMVTELENDANSGYARWLDHPSWAALASAYFVIAIKPEFENAPSWAQGDKDHVRFGVGAPLFEAKPGETVSRAFQVYVGPKEKHALRAAWAGLDSTWTFYHTFIWSASLGSAMDLFSKALLAVLNWFHDHVYANYGIAIIFLTLLVRSAVFPLTIKSMLGMKKMQKLQPEMAEIKEKYKDNPQEQQQKLMELYRERGVNPVAGCFPLLLQMPVFFALYRMLWTAIELRGAPFAAWIHDLSEPDRLFVFAQPIPLILFNLHSINLLPLVMAVVMWASTKLMPQTGPVVTPEQKMMMNIMPVMFALFCYEQASGLSLYIITSTLLGMAQSQIVNRLNWEVDVSKKPEKPGAKKKQHWFDAALEKKKQLEKEQKELKKQQRDAALRGADMGKAGQTPQGKKNGRGEKKP